MAYKSIKIINLSMKPVFLAITLLFITFIPSKAAKRIEAHPINIAVSLVEKTDSAKVASSLEYYGYTLQGNEDGYAIMKDSKGNEIQYTFTDNNSPLKYPTVRVKTHASHQSIDNRLKDLSFDKVGNGYEKVRNQYSQYKTICSFGPNSSLIIRRIQQ